MYGLETWVTGRTYDIGDNRVPNEFSRGCRVFCSKIVLHEAYDSDALIDLLDADALTGQYG